MSENTNSFGKIILEARRKKGLTLKQCAALVKKEDGSQVSFTFLSDLENGNRTPSEQTIKQLALVLDVPVEYLYVHARTFPKEMTVNADREVVVAAFQTFLKIIG